MLTLETILMMGVAMIAVIAVATMGTEIIDFVRDQINPLLAA